MNRKKRINRRNFLKLGMSAGGSALALSAIPINLVAADEVTGQEGGGGRTSGDVFGSAVKGVGDVVALRASTRAVVAGHG